MAGIRICKVCGKEYECCRNAAKPGQFRWQDVACCAEHGAIYFEEVMKARGITTRKAESPAVPEPKAAKKAKAKKSDRGIDDGHASVVPEKSE